MTKWKTVKEIMADTGKPRSTVIDMIKREGWETKKKEIEMLVKQKQTITLVRVEE